MAAQTATLFAGGLHQCQPFEEQHGEDAGHQVEDDATQEGKPNGGGSRDGAGILAGRQGSVRDRNLSGDDRSRHVIRLGVAQTNQAVQLCRQHLQGFGALDANADAVGDRLDDLVGGVDDLLLIKGIELGVGLGIATSVTTTSVLPPTTL